MPRPIPARRGLSVSYRGKNLLSLVDPIAQAERLADAAPKQDRTLYFCPSPLYGYGLERFLSLIPADSSVIAVETDEALMALSRESLPRTLLNNPQFRVVRTTDPASLCAFARGAWGSRRFRRLTVIRLSGGWQIGGACYEALADALREDIACDWENALTLARLGRRYMANAVRNLPQLIRGPPSPESLRFGEAPVLVLGAGPSLDRLLDALAAKPGAGGFLRPEERPFRIVCVDTALKNLYARGIKPDLAVALESQHWNLRDFIGLGGWKLPLAMDLSALPATGEALGGDVLPFFTPWTAIRLFGRLKAAGFLPPEIPALGSVGLTATALALRLGSGPVLTGALDFSFTIDRYHARSTPGHLENLRLSTRLRPLIRPAAFRAGVSAALGKNREPVLTDQALKHYRRLFEREFGGGPAPAGAARRCESRLRDIAGSGLDLGVETLSREAALELLAGGGKNGSEKGAGPGRASPGGSAETAAERMESFLRRERETLAELRGILTGKTGSGRLEILLDECDYLWAHFPDCAETGGRRPGAGDISFLKRVRFEIDPFLKLWDLALSLCKT